jgi:maltose/moltooligosaccharide transporter
VASSLAGFVPGFLANRWTDIDAIAAALEQADYESVRVLGHKLSHSVCPLCGAGGLSSVLLIHNQYLLLLSMTGVGIAWASALAMPYSILAGSLPAEKMGVYMGIFNFFIVIPEILASLGLGWIMNHVLGNNRMAAVVTGGAFLALAALLMRRVHDKEVAA